MVNYGGGAQGSKSVGTAMYSWLAILYFHFFIYLISKRLRTGILPTILPLIKKSNVREIDRIQQLSDVNLVRFHDKGLGKGIHVFIRRRVDGSGEFKCSGVRTSRVIRIMCPGSLWGLDLRRNGISIFRQRIYVYTIL
jgi:hypothetical protein